MYISNFWPWDRSKRKSSQFVWCTIRNIQAHLRPIQSVVVRYAHVLTCVALRPQIQFKWAWLHITTDQQLGPASFFNAVHGNKIHCIFMSVYCSTYYTSDWMAQQCMAHFVACYHDACHALSTLPYIGLKGPLDLKNIAWNYLNNKCVWTWNYTISGVIRPGSAVWSNYKIYVDPFLQKVGQQWPLPNL